MTTQRRTAAIATAIAALVVFASWLYFRWGGPSVTSMVGDVGAIASSGIAVGCAVAAARAVPGRQRVAWACLAAGLFGWFVSDVFLAHFHSGAHDAQASPAFTDVGYLMLPVGVCAGALFVPYGGLRSSIRVLLDGVIVASSLFVVAWAGVLRDLFAIGGVSRSSFAVSVACPIADVAMVTVTLMFLAKSHPGRRLSPALMAVALVVIGASDCAYVYAVAHGAGAGRLVILGWAVGMCVIGFAGLGSRPVRVSPTATLRAPAPAALWVPYLPVPFAVALGARELWTGSAKSPILVAGLVLIFAALVRQFLLLDENRRLLVSIADVALRDPLTGLANRALFTDRLAHAMQLRERTGAPVGVLVADLDDFKLVNDSLGHPVGDDLLCRVGERIQNSIRPGDTVARLGGDEFAILVEDAPSVAEHIAERVVRAFDEPFPMHGRPVYMRLSVGLATAVGEADVTANELFKHADLAMYSAKRAHVGARSFTPDMGLDATELNLPSQQEQTGRRSGIARIQFVGDLRRAIDERQLDLVYQPKVSLTTGSTVGVEALIRWPHPEFGLLEPADFLPLVRENGLMEAVTDLVLERAVGDAASWYSAGLVLPVAINLSAPSLNDEALPERILSVLADHDMPASALSVEITEDLLLASVVRAREVLDRLRDNGIRVAIDDFGSGYAAMTYLHELPVDELKLDRQFIAPILHDDRAAAIVASVIQLADKFGLTSVAEGVEDKATAELLASFGCGFAQGHYFSTPVPAKVIRLGIGFSAAGDRHIMPTEATRPSWA